MTETLCDSGAVKLKAGINVSTAITATQYTQLINEAENFIVDKTRYDYVAAFSGLNSNKKYILQEAASCHAAICAINYDMSGFTTRQEALIMINILWAKLQECLRLLNDDNTRGWING
jgi:hypothetical protein